MMRDKIEIEQENSSLIEFIVHPEESRHFVITLIPEYHDVFKKYLLSACQINNPKSNEKNDPYISKENITTNGNQFKISRNRATSGIVLGFLSLLNPQFLDKVEYFKGGLPHLNLCKDILTRDRKKYPYPPAEIMKQELIIEDNLISAFINGKWYEDEIQFSDYCMHFDDFMKQDLNA